MSTSQKSVASTHRHTISHLFEAFNLLIAFTLAAFLITCSVLLFKTSQWIPSFVMFGLFIGTIAFAIYSLLSPPVIDPED